MSNQLTEQNFTCRDEQRGEIHKALIKEYEALSDRASEQKIKLHNGVLQQALANKYIYKFSLPKEPEKPLEADKPYILSIDGKTVKGCITAIPQDKLEVEIELYENEGRIIPTLEIIIDLKVLIDLIDRRIVAIDIEPSKFKTETATFLFNPDFNAQVPKLEKKLNHSRRNDKKELTEEQVAAISISLKQKLTIIWGPPGTGKTITLQGVIAELLSNGHKIIFASNTNNAIDELLKGLIGKSPYKIFDELKNEGKIVRIGSQTNDYIKKYFGSWEVAQYKTQEIQSEIKTLQEKIENEQKEFKIIQDELKQFENAKYLNNEIIKTTEKQKTILLSQKLQEQIEITNQCKNKIFTYIQESENAKDIVLRIGSIGEKLKNQKTKVAGINTIVHKLNTEIEANENGEKAIANKIENLENAFLSFLRHNNEIKTLKEKQTKIILKIQEEKSSVETYKKQQTTEISTESELTGDFVNTLVKLSTTVSQSCFDINSIQKYFEALNLVLKLEEQKPLWILLGEEFKVITGEKGDVINEFAAMRRVNQETITKKHEQIISEIEEHIENNEHLQIKYETELRNLQKQLFDYKHILEKPETYWSKRKEIVRQIQNIIEPIQTQLNCLNEKLRNIEKNVVKEAKLICCTLVKSSYDETLVECEFDTLVVEYACGLLQLDEPLNDYYLSTVRF